MSRTWERDPKAMRDLAQKMLNNMDTYDKSRTNMVNLVHNMKTYFDDPTSNKYVKQFSELEEDMKKLGALVKDFAEGLNSAARIIEESTNQN